MRLWVIRLVAALAVAMSVGGAVLVLTERGLEQKIIGTPIFIAGALLCLVPSILIERTCVSLKIKGERIR
jgi:threonine/homoserine/homoserine lactone efflux protein